MKTPFIEMKNITKRFTGVVALDNVNFDAYKGEILALVGENGAGKTTLINIVSGIYTYGTYFGEMLFEGKEQKFNSPQDAEKAGIALIPQELNPLLDMSVIENIWIGRMPTKLKFFTDTKKMFKGTEKVFKELNLNIDIHDNLRRFNASEQQLVAIARALSTNADIIVLDEPTSCLTKNETSTLFRVLKELRSKDKCIIYISHKLDEVMELADRVTILRDGSSVGTLDKNEIKHKLIVQMMVGRNVKNMYPKVEAEKGKLILDVKDLKITHKYINKNIINGISFKGYAGEIIGLAGLVGSGRSEILNTIFGSYKGRVEGKVYVNKKKLTFNSPKMGKKAGIGLLTEDRRFNGFIQEMSVKENISLANLDKISSRKLFIRTQKENILADDGIEKLNIKTPSRETLVKNLSGGNQQKVVLTKWLETNPLLLLLDEPTRGIDVGAKVEIYKIMGRFAQQGLCIVWASSELPELLEISDRVLVLHEGKIRAEFKREEVTQQNVMYAATGGE